MTVFVNFGEPTIRLKVEIEGKHSDDWGSSMDKMTQDWEENFK